MDGSAIVVDTALPVNSEPKRLNANLYTQSNARIWDKSISLAGIQNPRPLWYQASQLPIELPCFGMHCKLKMFQANSKQL